MVEVDLEQGQEEVILGETPLNNLLIFNESFNNYREITLNSGYSNPTDGADDPGIGNPSTAQEQ